MRCEEFTNDLLLDTLLEGAGAPSHLDRCPHCQSRLEQLRGTLDGLRILGGPEAQAADGRAVPEILARLPADVPIDRPPQKRRASLSRLLRRKSPGLGLWVAAAAGAMLALGIWFFASSEAGRERPAVAGKGWEKARGGPTVHDERPRDGSFAPSPVRTLAAAKDAQGRATPEEHNLVQPGPPEPRDPPAGVAAKVEGEALRAHGPESPSPTAARQPDTALVPFGSLARARGAVFYRRRGGKWNRAVAGVKFVGGEEIDTRTGMAAIELESGGRILCNKSTWVVVEKSRLRLRRGEVCCKFGPGDGIAVESADGVVRYLGTRFSVKVLPGGTTVTVEEGRVVVENEKGRAEVRGGFQVEARRGFAPGRPRKVDVAKALAWAATLRAEELLFADDFNRSSLQQWPAGWERHATEAASRSAFLVLPEPGNRFIGCKNRETGATQHAFVPGDEWGSEVKISAHMRLSGTGNLRAGVQLENRSLNRYFSIDYSASERVLALKKAAPGESWKAARSVSLSLRIGRWYALEVSTRDGVLSCAINGKRLLAFKLDSSWPVERISLLSRGPDSAHYDNVRVFGDRR